MSHLIRLYAVCKSLLSPVAEKELKRMDTIWEATVKLFYLPLQRRLFLKKKIKAPHGSTFYPFRVVPFSEGTSVHESKWEVTKFDLSLLLEMVHYLLRAGLGGSVGWAIRLETRR